jgi:large subunit ribosomal protein L23
MGIFSKKKEDNKEVDAKKAPAKKDVKKDTKKAKAKKKVVADVQSTKEAYGVLVSPIITEKSHAAAQDNKYTFRVEKTATKQQIKKVIEEMYGVSVESINTVVVKPKRRTVKYDRGYQKLYKKAIVTLKKGDTIAIFEGV